MWEDVEDQVMEIFYEVIFEPVVEILREFGKTEILNAINPLISALRSGKVQYTNGVFSGQFNSSISKQLLAMGAKFHKREKVFYLAIEKTPEYIRAEAAAFRIRAQTIHSKIKSKLVDISENINKMISGKFVDAKDAVVGFDKSFEKIADKLRVAPTISTASQKQLKAEYNDNMKLWIQKFSEQSITDLREIVTDNAERGYRFDSLVSKISDRYSVAKSKAKFLARQETGLFMAKYRQLRFTEAGVRKYRWSTSHDQRVRHDHRELDGTIQFYSEPPIVDRSTGRKANPGQDYNCRCVDEPIIEERAAAA